MKDQTHRGTILTLLYKELNDLETSLDKIKDTHFEIFDLRNIHEDLIKQVELEINNYTLCITWFKKI